MVEATGATSVYDAKFVDVGCLPVSEDDFSFKTGYTKHASIKFSLASVELIL